MKSTGRNSAKDGQERTSQGTCEGKENMAYDRYRNELGNGWRRKDKSRDLGREKE